MVNLVFRDLLPDTQACLRVPSLTACCEQGFLSTRSPRSLTHRLTSPMPCSSLQIPKQKQEPCSTTQGLHWFSELFCPGAGPSPRYPSAAPSTRPLSQSPILQGKTERGRISPDPIQGGKKIWLSCLTQESFTCT